MSPARRSTAQPYFRCAAAEALALLSAEKFAKMIAFVHSSAHQRVRTNNHVERMNRQLRYLEKVRYKWRRRRAVVCFVILTLGRWQRRQARPAVQDPAARAPVRPTDGPSTSRGRARSAA